MKNEMLQCVRLLRSAINSAPGIEIRSAITLLKNEGLHVISRCLYQCHINTGRTGGVLVSNEGRRLDLTLKVAFFYIIAGKIHHLLNSIKALFNINLQCVHHYQRKWIGLILKRRNLNWNQCEKPNDIHVINYLGNFRKSMHNGAQSVIPFQCGI